MLTNCVPKSNCISLFDPWTHKAFNDSKILMFSSRTRNALFFVHVFFQNRVRNRACGTMRRHEHAMNKTWTTYGCYVFQEVTPSCISHVLNCFRIFDFLWQLFSSHLWVLVRIFKRFRLLMCSNFTEERHELLMKN